MIQNDDNQELVQIGLMGDTMLGRLVNEKLGFVEPNYVWGDLLPFLQVNDLNIINLECALTFSDKIVQKVFNFKANPDRVRSLLEARIHVANLANNHVLDFSEDGLLETLNILDKAGIKHVGAGRNINEASEPLIISIKGLKIGILGCSDNEPTWSATESSPGIKYLEIGDLSAIENDIRMLRPQVDLLILSIHWGPNMRERPKQNFIQFAHDLIDLGVDVIHGHSAHIFQGIEVYKGKIILYDTGDFIDDYYVDPSLRNDRSFLFIIECKRKNLQSLRLIPTKISNFQVNLAKGNESKKIMERMQNLSKDMHSKFILLDNQMELRF